MSFQYFCVASCSNNAIFVGFSLICLETVKVWVSFKKAKIILDQTKLLFDCDPGKHLILAIDISPFPDWVQFYFIKCQVAVKNQNWDSKTLSKTETIYKLRKKI